MIGGGVFLRQYFLPSASTTAAAVVAVIVLALLNLGPADVVGRAETFLVALKVGILVVLVVYGLIYVSPDDFSPLAPQGGGSLLRVTAMLFTASIGFNVVTNMAGSVRRPERTVPLAIILSIVISALVYVGVIVALLASGVNHFGEAGLGKAAEALMGAWGALLIVNVAAYKLARQHWPAPGMRLRGGVALPVVAFLTAAAQLPSLGWADVLLGTAMVFAGLFIYALRHRPELAADPDPMLRAIERLETPLARALRRPEKA